MLKSALLRRVLLLIFITVLLSALLTLGIYTLITRNTFADLKGSELLPRSRAIAGLVSQYLQGFLSESAFKRLVGSDSSLWDAELLIYNKNDLLIAYARPENGSDSELSQEEYLEKRYNMLSAYIDSVNSGETVTDANTRFGYLIVGVPVRAGQEYGGSVFLIKPLVELNAALSGLNSTLLLVMVIVFVVMLIPAFFASRRIIRPLNQMRDVSLAMSQGNFAVQADETQKGEIGELGRSLNLLSSRLNMTISALVLERNRLWQILNVLSEGIVATNKKGVVTHYNPAILRLFGHPETYRPTQKIELIPYSSLWEDFDRAAAEQVRITRMLQLPGSVLSVSISPIESAEGESAGAVGMFRDVTESERLEQTRRDYVANVSHELKTPVSAIRSLAETLNDGLITADEDRSRYYGYILRECMRLSRLIDDLLELSRLQSGGVALERKKIDLSALLIEIAERYSAIADESGIKFVLDESARTVPEAFGNADRIEQVLVIILDNAIKFTPEEGSVTLSAASDDEKVYITVTDTGPGIDKKDLPYIFERFYKADSSHSTTGTGLGLAIAKEVLAQMGEDLTASSEPGKGASFTFTVSRNPN